MGKRAIAILFVLAVIVAVLQYTPLHFLSKDALDVVWGLVVGLGIGAAVSWAATRT